jgi:membrane peptidoglycan carboxypeptidase
MLLSQKVLNPSTGVNMKRNNKSNSSKPVNKSFRLWFKVFLSFLLASQVGGAIALAAVIYIAKDLPTGKPVLDYRTPVNTLIVDDKGEVVSEQFNGCYTSEIKDNEFSQTLINTAMLSEDARFNDLAVNPVSLSRAAISNLLTGKTEQGGSGITAQFAKLYLDEVTDRANKSPMIKKVEDNVMAIRLRSTFGWKPRRVIENYLQRAASDGNVCGFKSYLQQYHRTELKDATLQQEVMYISQLPNPNQFNPNLYPNAAQKQYSLTLGKILNNGEKYNLVTPEQLDQYKDLLTKPLPKTFEPNFTEFKGSWAKSANTDELAETQKPSEYQSRGYTFVSSVDSQFQTIAEKIVQGFGREGRVIGDIGVALIDADNMTLLATVGGKKPYALDYQLNRSFNTEGPTGSVTKVAVTFVFLQDLFEHDPNASLDYVSLLPNWTKGPQFGTASIVGGMAASENHVFISALMRARETRTEGLERIKSILAKYPVSDPLKAESYYSIDLDKVAKDFGVCNITIKELIEAHTQIKQGGDLPENLERTGVLKLIELWNKAGIKRSCTNNGTLNLGVQDHANALGSYSTNLLQSSTIMSLAGNGGFTFKRSGLGNSPVTSYSKVYDRDGKLIFDSNESEKIPVVAPRVAAKVKEATRAVMGGTGRKGVISGVEDQGAKTGTHESQVINFTTWYLVNGKTYVLTIKMMYDDYRSFGDGVFSGDYVAPLAAELGSAHVRYLKSKK